jgi:hypothetical protein
MRRAQSSRHGRRRVRRVRQDTPEIDRFDWHFVVLHLPDGWTIGSVMLVEGPSKGDFDWADEKGSD